MTERLESTLRAFENEEFISALDRLREAGQAWEKSDHKLWKTVYKKYKDDSSSPSDVSMAAEVAIAHPEDMLSGKEMKRYAARQKSQIELEAKESGVLRLCDDEALGLDTISRWAIRRHLSKAVLGRDTLLGGVMGTIGHLDVVDSMLKDTRHELLTVFGSYGTVGSALNDGEGLRIDAHGRAVLTGGRTYTLGTLPFSRDMLIANDSLSLEMSELDTNYALLNGEWAEILRFGWQKKSDLPKILFGEPVEGPNVGDIYNLLENQDYLDGVVERARVVAGLAIGVMDLDNPSLQRFEINPKL